MGNKARSIAALVEAHLAEAEIDCGNHTFGVRVTYRPEEKVTKRPRIIAALLRQLAEHTDGFCAMRGATDEDFVGQGMVLWFSSDEKRDEFLSKRLPYLSETVLTRFSAAKT